MKTNDLRGEKIILIDQSSGDTDMDVCRHSVIDNEFSTITKNDMKDEKHRKLFCCIQNILYIGAFILTVFLIFLMKEKDFKKVYLSRRYYDTEVSVSDDPVTEKTVIEQKVAELQGLVSLKNRVFGLSKADLNFSALTKRSR